jgi:putative copper export protein
VRELLELNRYAHDFTAAMWVCGSILIWLLCREIERTGAPVDSRRVFQRLARKIALITVPSLVITLASGGVRAMTFTRYEYVGQITTSLTVILVVKHALFAALIAWGIWIHLRSRRLGTVTGGPS